MQDVSAVQKSPRCARSRRDVSNVAESSGRDVAVEQGKRCKSVLTSAPESAGRWSSMMIIYTPRTKSASARDLLYAFQNYNDIFRRF